MALYVALNGFGDVFSREFARRCKSIGAVAVHIGRPARSRSDFDQIVRRLQQIIIHSKVEKSVSRFVILSNLDAEFQEIEANYFCPAALRIAFPIPNHNDPSFVQRAIDNLKYSLKSFDSEVNKKAVISRGSILRLPLRNIGEGRYAEDIRNIFWLQKKDISTYCKRRIKFVSSKSIFECRSLQFKPAKNSARHPVRRITNSSECDLKAWFRLSYSIDERFEFDVTTTGNWSGKRLHQCCGTAESVQTGKTHINMRINDDFKTG